MKQIVLRVYSFILCFVSLLACQDAIAQTMICNKDTALYINFGAGNSKDMNLSFLEDYHFDQGNCPNDGYFSFVASTSDCFEGNWVTVPQDHTPGDMNGKMMLVNSSEEPGEFFATKIIGLRGSTTYELSAWLMNVCRRTVGCKTLYPDIGFTLENTAGVRYAGFYTGQIPTEQAPVWRRYSFTFTTPPIIGRVYLVINNKSPGGCGNDFALDDILITRCEIIPPKTKKEETKEPAKPVIKPRPDTSQFVKREKPVTTLPVPVERIPDIKPDIREPVKITRPEPKILQTRSNPVVKQIITDSTELKIEIYDNGVIDGDTVSVYHNNELVIAHAALLAKPIKLTIKVDSQHPHHELVMVADNLGSIPPNTSLMVITAKDKRYEVFIASDDKKNAKIIIELKE